MEVTRAALRLPLGKSARLTCSVFCLFILFSCSSIEDKTHRDKYQTSLQIESFARHEDLFGKRVIYPTENEIFALTAIQSSRFFEFMESNSSAKPNDRLASYLLENGSKLRYGAETNIASTVLETLEGNCLSLAILTSAFARLAGVKITYELVDANPTFEFDDDIVLKGVHVRAVLWDTNYSKIKSRNSYKISMSKRYVKIDFFPTGNERLLNAISEENFIARFYLNHAAEAIEVKNYPEAYWLTRAALEKDPGNFDALNHLAVLYTRVNQLASAQEVYLYLVSMKPHDITILKNYSVLLKRQGDEDTLALINAKIAELDDPNPYKWLISGKRFVAQKDFTNALKSYKKALAKAPYLHEAQLGLAQTYLGLGNIKSAKEALKTAVHMSDRDSTRLIYKSKLISLIEGERHRP